MQAKREFLFDDPERIYHELVGLIRKAAPLLFYRKDAPLVSVLPKAIDRKVDPPLVVFVKNGRLETSPGTCCCFFYRPPQQLVRGFQTTVLKESEAAFAVRFPDHLFQLQRRKAQRVTTPPPSHARLRFEDLEITGEIADVCVEGAKLQGSFPPELREGAVIGPLELSLHLQYVQETEVIKIPQAEVIWVRRREPELIKAGLHFLLAGEDLENLRHYIQLRSVEESAARGCQY